MAGQGPGGPCHGVQNREFRACLNNEQKNIKEMSAQDGPGRPM
jgi:hypothetical protein